MNTNNIPKISIVLPTYNRERFLPQAIDAILAQTEQNWELIVVNDCSTDGTQKIVEEYAEKDDRIRLINNAVNKKLPASLNEGFRCARGKYYTWTSDDNFYHPHAIEMLARYLDTHPDTDLVSMNALLIDENGQFPLEVQDFSHVFEYKRNAAYLARYCNVHAAFMYTRAIAEKVGQYDESTFCAEDYDFWLRLALIGRIDYTDDVIYSYSLHAGSLTEMQKERVASKTIILKEKYIDDMLDKYYPKWSDKFNFIYTNRDIKLKRHRVVSFCVALYAEIVKRLTSLIFWSKKLRRTIRNNSIKKREKFSFSEKRES